MERLATSDQRRRMMSRIKGRDTGPEFGLRRSMWALHFCIRRTRPDVVLVRARLAVFVDGCFWHGSARSIRRWPRTTAISGHRNFCAIENEMWKALDCWKRMGGV
ncbi:hypothetical protein [Paucibacter sp. KBW04]|uniref:hypothetical protein n=1 Tax=Paucibacter sp. KBW04 TaxID=2153361 RepID=UPI00351A6125